MANSLGMDVVHMIVSLHRLGWSDRRIARELGIHRETVGRHLRLARAGPEPATNLPAGSPACPNPATNPPAGSSGPASACEGHREVILAKLGQGLSAQRIWQDLVADHQFAYAYDSVKRYVRRLGRVSELPFRRMECLPGAEMQVDFGTGASIHSAEGNRQRAVC